VTKARAPQQWGSLSGVRKATAAAGQKLPAHGVGKLQGPQPGLAGLQQPCCQLRTSSYPPPMGALLLLRSLHVSLPGSFVIDHIHTGAFKVSGSSRLQLTVPPKCPGDTTLMGHQLHYPIPQVSHHSSLHSSKLHS
jgi:hypothetical protein